MSRNSQEIQRNMSDGETAPRSTEEVPTEQVNSAGTPISERFHHWIGVNDRSHCAPLGFTWPKTLVPLSLLKQSMTCNQQVSH